MMLSSHRCIRHLAAQIQDACLHSFHNLLYIFTCNHCNTCLTTGFRSGLHNQFHFIIYSCSCSCLHPLKNKFYNLVNKTLVTRLFYSLHSLLNSSSKSKISYFEYNSSAYSKGTIKNK